MKNDYRDEQLQLFLKTMDAWRDAYNHCSLSYFSVKNKGALNLIYGRIFLHTMPSKISQARFESTNFLAGNFSLADMGVNAHDLILQVAQTGQVKTPIGILKLPLEGEREPAVHFEKFHHAGLSEGRRLQYLRISGAGQELYVRQPDVDWELKAAMTPFDSLPELLAEYSLAGAEQLNNTSVEVVAAQVGEVDFGSKVSGTVAKAGVFLAKSLDPKQCRLGFRIFLRGKVVGRGSVSGTDFKWSKKERTLHGVTKIKIPQGALLHCFLSYNGFTHHQGWLTDPKNFQNPRRALLDGTNNGLEVLRDCLFEERKNRNNSRDFEFGVAWLLWLMGFNASHFGAFPRLSDAPDIIATTPQGNILVVECTTGLLKEDSKLANLINRTEAVRKKMISSGHQASRILPVIVTALDKERVKGEIDAARKLGVVVLTKESLRESLDLTLVDINAEITFEKAWEAAHLYQDAK